MILKSMLIYGAAGQEDVDTEEVTLLESPVADLYTGLYSFFKIASLTVTVPICLSRGRWLGQPPGSG
jgi:hypothetical protein